MNILKNYKFYCTIILIGVFFLYGLLVGKYEVFPYKTILEIKNVINTQEQVQNRYENIEIIESSLQRLLIKKVNLIDEHSNYLIETGGAIGSIDNFIYISINRRDKNKGKIKVLNIDDHVELDSNGLKVPTKYSDMVNIYGSKMDKFNTKYLRVHGIYLDKNNHNEHDLYVTHHKFNIDKSCISFNVSHISLELDDYAINKKSNWNTLFEVDHCIPVKYDENESKFSRFSGHMAGGGIAEYGDDHLLISIGDHGYDGRGDRESFPMDSNSLFGKLILLNKKTGSF